ncbi:MAG: ATP-binding protein [Desulfovibrio sp.]|nr:ATP-binding protein [Desulfovibrio sp.]
MAKHTSPVLWAWKPASSFTLFAVRLPELLVDLKIAKETNSMRKVLQKYMRFELLIMDEWMFIKCAQDEQFDLLKLIHNRSTSGSLIFCSQLRVDGWYEQLGGASTPLADAIMDSIVHSSCQLNIQPHNQSKDISMRESYGPKALNE